MEILVADRDLDARAGSAISHCWLGPGGCLARRCKAKTDSWRTLALLVTMRGYQGRRAALWGRRAALAGLRPVGPVENGRFVAI